LISASSHLSQDGQILFSVETASRTGLSSSGRFLYMPQDVERIILESGYVVVVRQETKLHYDEKTVTKGLLFVARLGS
jgi:predicted TPR repeat methyltransferase